MLGIETLGQLLVTLIVSIIGSCISSLIIRWSGRTWLVTIPLVSLVIVVASFVLLYVQTGTPLDPSDHVEEMVGDKSEISDATAIVRKRTFEFTKGNYHCRGPINVQWKIRAGDGWKIDRGSVIARATHESSKSRYEGVFDLPEKDTRPGDGFMVRGRVANNGQCLKFFGKVIAKDGRGLLRVGGTYNEVRDIGTS